MMDLERLAAEAVALAGGDHPCHVLGHRWEFAGGRACCCELKDGDYRWLGECSLPVHQCKVCEDFDYGENAEADEIRGACDVEGRGDG